MEGDGARRGLFLTGFDLKLIAIVAMLIDHIGAIFFPNLLALRVIGRLTMPIMCFFVAEGYRKTSNLKRYISRMLVFAFLAQIPFMVAFPYLRTSDGMALNVLFTFVLGLAALYVMEGAYRFYGKILGVVFIVYIGAVLRVDYSDIGVLMVLAFGLGRGDKGKMIRNFCIFVGLAVFLPSLYGIVSQTFSFAGARITDPSSYGAWITQTVEMVRFNPGWILQNFLQTFCVLAAPLLALYSGRRGRDMRFLFYVFYPVHLLILGILRMLL